MSSVIMGSRCMTASSSNDEPSQDGLFHRLRGLATARCGHDGPRAKPDRAARWASGGLRPAVLSSPPRPELQYRRTGPPEADLGYEGERAALTTPIKRSTDA